MLTSDKEKKKELLSKIFLKEEDTLKELGELVDLSSPFFKIEQETANVVFNSAFSPSNKDKILLLLVGRYFAREMEIIEKDALVIGELSRQLNIPNTTLSAPLGELVKNKIVNKNEQGEYNIVHHQIKNELQKLSNKKN